MAKRNYILLFAQLIVCNIYLFAQEQVPVIDSVCPGEIDQRYAVHPSRTDTYFDWEIEGGRFSPNDTNHNDSIAIIDWLENADIEKYSLTVVEYTIINDKLGCSGEKVTVDIGFKDNSKVKFEEGSEIYLCIGENKEFVVGENFKYYEWKGGGYSKRGEDAYSFDIAEMSPTSFSLHIRVVTEDNCESVDSIQVYYNPYPLVDFSSTSTEYTDLEPITDDTLKICKDEYEIDPGNFNFYEWSTGDITSTITMGEVIEDTTIYLTVSNVYGNKECKTIDSIFIERCSVPVVIYTAFTPDGDGFNDVWKIDGIHRFPDAEIRVYDRNKNLVFEWTDGIYEGNEWDGKTADGILLPVDSYHYVVDLNDEESEVEPGSVTIIY